MKSKSITLEWRNNGIRRGKEESRQDMYDVFLSIAKGFQNDNEISTKLVNDILPKADLIFIDKDRNESMDVPMITYVIDEKEEALKIMRHHKIVWAILDKYFSSKNE